MFSLDEFRTFYDSGGPWTCDLNDVPQLDKDVMEAHFSSSARQQNKGWVFKEEKYIRRIEVSTHHHSSGCDVFVLRSICLCSMKPGHYRQLAALREDSPGSVSVVQAHCNCVAGYVLLFQIYKVCTYVLKRCVNVKRDGNTYAKVDIQVSALNLLNAKLNELRI